MASFNTKRLSQHLWHSIEEQTPLSVYALLDAAREEIIYPSLLDSGVKKTCLFRGDKARELAWVAPYLVQLTREDPFTEWLLEKGWGKSWGIFVESSAVFNQLKRHFQTFLTVYDKASNALLFRYYDPRVLRIYLRTCTPKELKTVFGPITCFAMEDENVSTMLQFRKNNDVLAMETVSLA
jgi:hypothetical protein